MTLDPSASLKLRLDMRCDELKVLNSLENWATSLFLGAIGLISKQIIDWGNPAASPSCTALTLHWPLFLLPAAVGLVGFIYLRSLNYRIRDVRSRLYALAPIQDDAKPSSCGLVGWSMALMPLAFGYAASGYLGIDNPKITELSCPIGGLSIAVAIACFAGAVAIFKRQEKRLTESCK